ncbi:MAG: c-type cytochrome [Bacteroidales bacterium]|nr:c-type cytochrome [Bacteroidales bacterium]
MKKHLHISILNFLCVVAFVVLCACPGKPPKPLPRPYTIEIPLHFPTILNIPSDNPMTIEGVELGRHLFYEGRLSGRFELDSMMSCFSCHRQENAFESGMDNQFYDTETGRMLGLTGIKTPHAMMPLINLVFQHDGYMWNGMVHSSNQNLGNANYGVPAQEPFNQKNLESFVWMMIAAPHEIHGTIERSVNAIASISKYPPMFEAAFGTPEVTIDRICKAIAQFVRTLISADSKYDRFKQGRAQLTDDEFAGYQLFSSETADCFHCHGGDGNRLFSTYGFSNNGLDAEHNDLRDRFFITQNPQDIGKYKIPTLRNIALTAPYMHDGRFKTLEEVIEFYSTGLKWSPTIDPNMKQVNQGGVQLTDVQKRQLIAFLHTLTDSTFITNPKFAKP